MLTNLPKTVDATNFLDTFDIGDVDASEDSLLKNELCVCKIHPIRDFLKGNKSIVLGHRGAGVNTPLLVPNTFKNSDINIVG